MKVALVYDRVNKWGGAERILVALHELFPDAPLYTAVYNPKKAKWATIFSQGVKPSFLQRFPFAKSHHELYAMLMPTAFESFSFDDYNLVISVTSEAAKGIITNPQTKHICICLTPTRYLWSGYTSYFENSIFRLFAKPAIKYLQKWDIIASERPDYYFAISEEVQKRIAKYYKKDSKIIYPPVTLSNSLKNNPQKRLTDNYFLIVSRLVHYKRIDIAIKACNKLKLPLVIIGSGIEEKILKEIAGRTIYFLGNLTDHELIEYYNNCISLIFPGVEDFGLTILEAQQFGKPVIAYKEGGAIETIIEGKTGVFFYPQTQKALIEVLRKFDPKKFNSEDCKKQAKKFNKQAFRDNLMEIVTILIS